MTIKEIALSKLKEYGNNPRHNDAAVEAVANSIREFGFKVPIIIDADNVIVAGHTRKRAAEMLGLEKVPCIVADDLTPEQIKAFRVADNKTAELADWDFEKLETELEELAELGLDMEQFGFEDMSIPAQVELEREEMGTAERIKSIKYGSVTIPLTEEEAETFENSFNGYLKENGTLYGYIDYILGGVEK